MAAGDIFSAPIGTDAPPANIGRKSDHPVARKGITKNGPIETNKFYANFFLGEQTSPTFLHPYSVAWAKGKGASGSWGLAISHIDAKQRVYGPAKAGTGAAAYFINPIGIQSVVLSANELGSSSALTTESPTDMSVQVSLRPNGAGSNPAIQFPLVQGSAFITAIYNGATPMIQTGVFYSTVTRMTQNPKAGVVKYKLAMADGTTWLLYARHTQGNALDLQVVNNGLAQATGAFTGTIQIAKDPGNGEAVYDKACGAYPTGVTLSGSVSGVTGTYGFSFKKAGMTDATLAMFALPHHQSSFDAATKGKVTDVKLQTTTKGIAAAVVADSWTMVESNLPTSVGFLPWSPQAGSLNALSGATKQTVLRIAQKEMSQNMLEQSNLNSMYYSGKVREKFFL
jgi:endo-1,3(4)-beta-glucanase